MKAMPEIPETLAQRNRLLALADGQEEAARIYAQGGTTPNPLLEMPVSAERCSNKAAEYRRRAAMYVRDVEGG